MSNKKAWLIVKNNDLYNEATILFQGTDINITTDGKRHLGAVLESPEYRTEYIRELEDE